MSAVETQDDIDDTIRSYRLDIGQWNVVIIAIQPIASCTDATHHHTRIAESKGELNGIERCSELAGFVYL